MSQKIQSSGLMKKKLAAAFTMIIGTVIGIIWVSPFYVLFINSFKTKKEIFNDTIGLPDKWIFDNYVKAAKDLNFVSTFINSLIIMIASIVIIAVFSSMAAYALDRDKKPRSMIIFLIFAASMLIPFQTVMIPLISLFGAVNLLNRAGLIFMYTGFGSSMAIFLFHGALKGVPASLDEAALIDGCGRFRTFWQIIFPNLKPVTVTVAILDIIWIWNDYLLPSLVINRKGMETLPLMMFYFFGQYTKQWHLALAGLTLAILPIIIFYFIAQKQIIQGIVSGAVKQ